MAKKGGSQQLKDQNRWQLWLIIAVNAVASGRSPARWAVASCSASAAARSGSTARRSCSRVAREGDAIAIRFVDADGKVGNAHLLQSPWKPGDPVWQGTIDGHFVAVQTRPIANGIRLAHQGVEVPVYVWTEAEAASARLMPVMTASDTGKKLLCPMPGLIVSIAVTEGQEVKAGETLAVVEAMKMQNVLRAEQDGTVKKIYATAGGGCADPGVRVIELTALDETDQRPVTLCSTTVMPPLCRGLGATPPAALKIIANRHRRCDACYREIPNHSGVRIVRFIPEMKNHPCKRAARGTDQI
ncbi:hypothetical protein BDS110ZK4_60820 [Bradyrhizobium diazoefficiens]|uniref:propionyl-CoA carboxylase n=1 Tax=Bradyrhizobium diazoefficiens TaxID=1355477 RepID=A0A809WYE0_9BRAD|nr:hypothetical protein XF1B_24760 [Bradyrhizobium diazoefficiens]BCE46048.1 hypothetical protein XF4B_23970 [Bradyrhizobium diazoefficiens]BCE89573.1 hypothetical protein XF10B_23710 [Bradyrhizobium diazoefficiens]BCF24513.1 hypothetical protein XF14B_24650 [Bradyrhizobium diazoefficiens]